MYMVVKAYRPIIITSFLPKTLEKLIDKHIEDRVVKPVSPNQHAYQAGKWYANDSVPGQQ